MGVFLIEICDTSHWRRTRMPAWWGDWGASKKVLHDFAARVTSQPISIGVLRSRAMLEGVRAHSLSKAEPPWAGAGSETGPSAL